MKKSKCIEILIKELEPLGAKIYNYRGTEFIAIQNPYCENHLAITFGEEDFQMEFTYQAARFSYDNPSDCVTHVKRYLSDELCAVEIFLSGKPLFGGSRESAKISLDSAEDFASFYACGNERISANLLGFMKNGGVSIKIFSWSGRFNRSFEIAVNGDELTVNQD